MSKKIYVPNVFHLRKSRSLGKLNCRFLQCVAFSQEIIKDIAVIIVCMFGIISQTIWADELRLKWSTG